MKNQRAYLAGLAQLHRLGDEEERRGVWRQAMAQLAQAAAQREPAPLEGLDPEALREGMRAALDTGLLDDLAWLSPAAAAVAMFELASALPAGVEKRALGRRVLRQLHEGDAATFVALATSLALSSPAALHGAVRARVALALATPHGAGTAIDALALALVSRRDLEADWLTGPSTGSLPSRRLAARLLERAAREAQRRLGDGDEGGTAIFTRAGVQEAWARLLADRESLVWRHVAVARGLLAHVIPAYAREISHDLQLTPTIGATRWRRAAASLAASLAVDPAAALARCRELMRGEHMRRDPGVARALMYGLSAAFETEPESANAFAFELIEPGGLEAIEALVELRRDMDGVGDSAADAARSWLARALAADKAQDDGRTALLHALRHELAGAEARAGVGASGSLGGPLRAACAAFVEGDPMRALEQACVALAAATETIDWLEHARTDDEPLIRRHAFRVLRELDVGLLETSTLADLLALTQPDDAEGRAAGELGVLLVRLERWLLDRESRPEPAGDVAHFTLRLARLRALVHLMDGEGRPSDEAGQGLRERRLHAARSLLSRTRTDRSPLARAVWAAAARAWDGLLRDQLIELSDLLIGLVTCSAPEEDFAVLREATMMPEVARLFDAQVDAARTARAAFEANGEGPRMTEALASMMRYTRALPPATSARVEALRTSMLRYTRALELIVDARSLTTLHPEALDRLEVAAQTLAHLVAGARRRLGLSAPTEAPAIGAALRLANFAIERARRGAPGQHGDEIAAAIETLREELLPTPGHAGAAALARLARLPVHAPALPQHDLQPDRASSSEPVLPSWLPPGRTLGGFYVQRAIGTGSGGSVFVASRAEERHDDHAERFALKVPDYDGGAARNLSEEEFERLFREEARALLALPEHANLSGFVTFDAGARPKPILVMELVSGPTLEHVLEAEQLDLGGAFTVLDGIAAGLEAMHESRVAHLDIKPANIILRGDPTFADGRARELHPVLVDFGLAGRKLRAGCGSPHYGAPEVWSPKLAEKVGKPFPADVYAFACLAYEILTGKLLVTGESMVAVVAAHLSGRAGRDELGRLGRSAGLRSLAELLASCLQLEAGSRPSITAVRTGMAKQQAALTAKKGVAWPLVEG